MKNKIYLLAFMAAFGMINAAEAPQAPREDIKERYSQILNLFEKIALTKEEKTLGYTLREGFRLEHRDTGWLRPNIVTTIKIKNLAHIANHCDKFPQGEETSVFMRDILQAVELDTKGVPVPYMEPAVAPHKPFNVYYSGSAGDFAKALKILESNPNKACVPCADFKAALEAWLQKA